MKLDASKTFQAMAEASCTVGGEELNSTFRGLLLQVIDDINKLC